MHRRGAMEEMTVREMPGRDLIWLGGFPARGWYPVQGKPHAWTEARRQSSANSFCIGTATQ